MMQSLGPPRFDGVAASSANRLIRRVATRYFVVLGAVTGLVVVDQAIVQPQLMRLNSYPPIINLAGRQRMLSQKLTKAALALQSTHDPAARTVRKEELRQTLGQWSAMHAALRDGNATLGLPKINTAEILQAWAALGPHFERMQDAAAAIDARAANGGLQLDKTTIRHIDVIASHEAEYLAAMDHIVTLLEGQAGEAVAQLRACALGIASVIIGLLAGLGWFVVRPATRAIRGQVDGLELRVATGTAELATANLALRREMVERQQAETRTQHLAAQLAHAARVSTMGHLTSGLAHELNQPLAAIVNYTETCEIVLSRGPDRTESLKRHLGSVRQAAMRAGQIVRRMRNFVRPKTDAPVEVDLHDLVREVVALCGAEIARSAVSVSLDLAIATLPSSWIRFKFNKCSSIWCTIPSKPCSLVRATGAA